MFNKKKTLTEEDKIKENYYAKTCYEFAMSEFCTAKRKKQMQKQLNGKEYLDYLIQKEKDYKKLYQLLLSLKYEYDYDFGKILELNSGPDVSFCDINFPKEFDITLVSPYGCDKLFECTDINYDLYKGKLEYLYEIKEDGKLNILKSFLSYSDENKENLKSLDDFDTILNINPQNQLDILNTYLYSREKNKYCFAGYITNSYDLLMDDKEEIMNYQVSVLKGAIKNEPQVYDIYEEGSRVRTIVNL